MDQTLALGSSRHPAPSAVLELLKPITWFAPMWAYACGLVSSGVPLTSRVPEILVGIILAGPLLCGTSQAVNDWYDRHVDAINEPNRPIPSGRIPGQWGLYIALIGSALALAVAAALGPWVFWAALAGMVLAWMYSAPPFRLKGNGWWGNASVAVSYEGLAWIAGAAVMSAAMPDWRIFALAALYSAGCHGIMTLNDFKAVEGDIKMGVRSLPVQLGVGPAARLACVVMIVPQLVVIGLLISWDRLLYGGAVAGLTLMQMGFMVRLLSDPRGLAPLYNATGITAYVLGMMVSAFAVRSLIGGGA
ncbi:MAG: chlorophyll synthase ChlG [Alphaproteobacteria bacterium]